jgi:lysophospholipase L1-like esterase
LRPLFVVLRRPGTAPAGLAGAWRWLAAVILAAGLAGLSACDGGRRLSPLADDAVILAFGDSLTFGSNASPGESYPAVLQQLTGRTVVNEGIPGELSAEGLARLPDLLDRHRPRLLLLCHGANDILRGMDQKQAADNVRAMVQLARDRDIDVVLIAVPKFGFLLAPAEWYREIAEATEIPLEEETMSRIVRDPALKSDQVHPNAAGYRRLAEAVAAKLREAGGI